MKVLKPGGKVCLPVLSFLHHLAHSFYSQFAVYEWCMTDAWDTNNVAHRVIQKNVELGNGIPEMRSIKACRTALENVGFEILVAEDLADRPEYVPLPLLFRLLPLH